jgi:hypothetical protein
VVAGTTLYLTIDPDGTVTEHRQAPTAGNLTGAHAILGPSLDVCSPRIDHLLVMWVNGEAHHLKLPVNPLAWLVYGGSKIRGRAVIGRDDGRPMTRGQVETVRALERTLATFGWQRAVALGRRYAEQDTRRR